MKALLLVPVLVTSLTAAANDGGVAAIKASEIKMREYEIRNHTEVEKRRITHPNFRIFVNGEEAAKLQAILPSSASVITAMQPELKAEYDRTFKYLGIYNTGSTGVTSKVLSIECNDGDLESVPGQDDKVFIKKKSRTECTISIVQADDPTDWFGDKQEFNPPVCQ